MHTGVMEGHIWLQKRRRTTCHVNAHAMLPCTALLHADGSWSLHHDRHSKPPAPASSVPSGVGGTHLELLLLVWMRLQGKLLRHVCSPFVIQQRRLAYAAWPTQQLLRLRHDCQQHTLKPRQGGRAAAGGAAAIAATAAACAQCLPSHGIQPPRHFCKQPSAGIHLRLHLLLQPQLLLLRAAVAKGPLGTLPAAAILILL